MADNNSVPGVQHYPHKVVSPDGSPDLQAKAGRMALGPIEQNNVSVLKKKGFSDDEAIYYGANPAGRVGGKP